MITITEGTEAKVKEEIKQRKKDHSENIKSQRKAIKEINSKIQKAKKAKDEEDLVKLTAKKAKLQKTLTNIQNNTIQNMSVTVIPIQLNGSDSLYNLKFIQEIMRKLKGFHVSMKLDALGTLVITYEKPYKVYGKYELKPLPYWYDGLKHYLKGTL